MTVRIYGWLAALAALSLVVGAAGCATTSQGQGQESSAPEVAEASEAEAGEAEASEGELVCRREHRTGTHISKRVCYTPEQLDQHAHDRREEDQQTLRDSTRWGCQGPGCSR